MSVYSSFIPWLFISLAISIGLLLLLREVICWYYKINRIIENQEQTQTQNNRIIYLLNSIDEKLGQNNKNITNSNVKQHAANHHPCQYCGAVMNAVGTFCPNCGKENT